MNKARNIFIKCAILLTAVLIVSGSVSPHAESDDPWRPKCHFTAASGWINDPNGLVYDSETGEYHMFFQHNQTVKEDIAAKCWGHAVSTDLVHWTELEPAILPDGLGAIWSGSAVVDYDNTSGLFDMSTPPGSRLVAFFTYYGGSAEYGTEKQGMAYSTDHGRTWIKYDGNPVLFDISITDGFRDPKVFRVSDGMGGEQWAMLVAGGDARLYTSRDLINWIFAGTCMDRDGNIIRTECPDMYQLIADDGTSHWVLSCAGRTYYTGEIVVGSDGGLTFNADSAAQTLVELPTDMYAGQTFSNMPEGRRVGIYWLVDTTMQQTDSAAALVGKNWDGAESLPVEFGLVRQAEGYRLTVRPAAEVSALLSPSPVWTSGTATISETGLALYPEGDCASVYVKLRFHGIDASRLAIDVLVRGEEATTLNYSFVSERLTIVRSGGTGAVARDNTFMSAPAEADGSVTLELFIDRSAVAIFDGGGHTAQGLVFPAADGAAGLVLRARSGAAELISAEVYTLSNVIEPGTEPQNGSDAQTAADNEVRGGLSAGVTAAIVGGIFILAAAVIAAILITNKKR